MCRIQSLVFPVGKKDLLSGLLHMPEPIHHFPVARHPAFGETDILYGLYIFQQMDTVEDLSFPQLLRELFRAFKLNIDIKVRLFLSVHCQTDG